MEDGYKKILEYLNAESKKGADRSNTILELRRLLSSKPFSVCIVGEPDELFASIAVYEKVPTLSWLSTNNSLDGYLSDVDTYHRHDVDTSGCLELFIRPYDIVIVQMNVAINHSYPQRIISRFLSMARVKCIILNSHKAFALDGQVKDAKEVIGHVETMNADKYTKKRDIQRSNGWTEFDRKVPAME